MAASGDPGFSDVPMAQWNSASGRVIVGLAAALSLAVSAAAEEAPPPVNGLLVDLAEGYCDTRRAAIEQLARSDDPRAVGAMLTALTDPEPSVRRAAVLGLWRLAKCEQRPGPEGVSGTPEAGLCAYDRLLDCLHDEHPLVRRGVCEVLGLLESPRALAPLLAGLADANPDVRASAAWGLGRLREPGAARGLVLALGDDFAQVRREAAWALGEMRDPASLEALAAALRDGEEPVRNSAASALAELKDLRAVPALLSALKEGDPVTRRQAARALGCLGETARGRDDAADALVDCLSDLDYLLRESAARALGRIRSPRGVSTLVEILADSEAQVRRAAAEALVQIGPDARPALAAAVESDKPLIKTGAREALRSLEQAQTASLAE